VAGWSAGDPVVAFLPEPDGAGAAAEYVAVPAGTLAAAPRTVELADAAVLPAVGLTAWQALFEQAGLQPGQAIVINGASGAVGGYAVQLAAQAGAIVTATASPRGIDRVRSYGADRVIDYTATPLPQALAGERFDVVLNLVRPVPEEATALVRGLAGLVADGGILVSTTTPGIQEAGLGVRAVQMSVRSDAAQLAGLVARVDAGTLKIHVTQRRPLTDMAAVHDALLAGQAGKTVLIP
jgi:NADPH:quinone reductase-like Zn-dependent oxidoreductase